MEPTVNGSTEDGEGTSSTTPSIVSRDQQELQPSCPGRGDLQEKSALDQTKGKLDDEDDEGVAQNSSIEDGESIQSSTETEKQGDKPTNQEVTQTKDIKPKGTEELLNGEQDKTINALVDQNKELSLKEESEVSGKSALSPDGPAGGAEPSEEERQKKSYETDIKTWLLERMQAPIEGRSLELQDKDICKDIKISNDV